MSLTNFTTCLWLHHNFPLQIASPRNFAWNGKSHLISLQTECKKETNVPTPASIFRFFQPRMVYKMGRKIGKKILCGCSILFIWNQKIYLFLLFIFIQSSRNSESKCKVNYGWLFDFTANNALEQTILNLLKHFLNI